VRPAHAERPVTSNVATRTLDRDGIDTPRWSDGSMIPEQPVNAVGFKCQNDDGPMKNCRTPDASVHPFDARCGALRRFRSTTRPCPRWACFLRVTILRPSARPAPRAPRPSPHALCPTAHPCPASAPPSPFSLP
jgi:hypothetical protein